MPEDRQSNKQSKHWLEYATAFFALMAGLGGLAAAIFTGLQWQNSQEQLAVARDQEVRQLRGYVIAKARSAALADQTASLAVVFNVLGATPIYHAHTVVSGTFGCNGSPFPDLRKSKWQRNTVGDVMFPSQIGEIWHSIDVSIDEDKINDFKNGKCSALIYGLVVYFDAFKARHFTSFCFMWNPKIAKDNSMDECPIWNSDDGEQKYADELPPP